MVQSIPYPVIDMYKTGENIKHLREERSISVSALQEYLGLASQQAIYNWQRGTCLPTVDHLCALSHLFSVPMDDILILKGAEQNHSPNMRYFAKAFPLMAM